MNINRNLGNNCICCGATMKFKNADLWGIRFIELEGAPTICSKCIYEKLTGLKGEWSKDSKNMLMDEITNGEK